MRGLTLTQPWAQLAAVGVKQVESRSWYTSYRGWVAIHAAKGMDRQAREFAATHAAPFLGQYGYEPAVGGSPLPRGQVVAVAYLEAVRDAGRIHWVEPHALSGGSWSLVTRPNGAGEYVREDVLVSIAERPFGFYDDEEEGPRFAWFLHRRQPLRRPVSVRGRLGLWLVDAETETAVRDALPDPRILDDAAA